MFRGSESSTSPPLHSQVWGVRIEKDPIIVIGGDFLIDEKG